MLAASAPSTGELQGSLYGQLRYRRLFYVTWQHSHAPYQTKEFKAFFASYLKGIQKYAGIEADVA